MVGNAGTGQPGIRALDTEPTALLGRGNYVLEGVVGAACILYSWHGATRRCARRRSEHNGEALKQLVAHPTCGMRTRVRRRRDGLPHTLRRVSGVQ